jgi:hypothetical protein
VHIHVHNPPLGGLAHMCTERQNGCLLKSTILMDRYNCTFKRIHILILYSSMNRYVNIYIHLGIHIYICINTRGISTHVYREAKWMFTRINNTNGQSVTYENVG